MEQASVRWSRRFRARHLPALGVGCMVVAFSAVGGCGRGAAEGGPLPSQSASATAQACARVPLADSLVSVSGRYVARFSVAEGTLRRMEVVDRRSNQAIREMTDDITGAQWLPDGERFVYVVGPIYGTPGIFTLDVREGTASRLIAPRTLNDSAYPDGADVFALCAIEGDSAGGVLVRFARGSHVDSVDFRAFPVGYPIDVLKVAPADREHPIEP